MKCAGFLVLLTVGVAVANSAQAAPSDRDEAGSVIVFAKFQKGKVLVDGVMRAQTEIEVRARCPKDTTCPETEPVKIKFHWVCPGGEDIAPKYVCKESDFDITLSVNGKTVLDPEDPGLLENSAAPAAPCPAGYLIGWVISPTIDRPIKYDGLSGTALLRDVGGAVESYQAFAIKADPNLAARAEIATELDPRTGTPALVFDGGAGHYQALAVSLPSNLEYHKLGGPLASGEGFLILLALDVRVNRPNYPTFIDLDFRTGRGLRASTSWHFRCWTEIQNPNIDANFTLAGAPTSDGIVIAGRAVKVPYGGVSDIPGPVTLLGLVPTDERHGGRTMEPVYVIEKFDGSRPTTVFLPFD